MPMHYFYMYIIATCTHVAWCLFVSKRDRSAMGAHLWYLCRWLKMKGAWRRVSRYYLFCSVHTYSHATCMYMYFEPTVDEVKTTLNKISTSLSTCVRLVRTLNSFLPEEERLEKFRLHPELEEDSDIEDDEPGVLLWLDCFYCTACHPWLSWLDALDTLLPFFFKRWAH